MRRLEAKYPEGGAALAALAPREIVTFSAMSCFLGNFARHRANSKPCIPKEGRLWPHSHLEIETFSALSGFVGHLVYHWIIVCQGSPKQARSHNDEAALALRGPQFHGAVRLCGALGSPMRRLEAKYSEGGAALAALASRYRNVLGVV